jgi:ribosome-binding protein aMBF1 (putative translation factor)
MVRITTQHPRSSYGIPVILGDDGEPLDYAPGVRAVRRALGLSTATLAGACGKSRRTIEDWEQGRYKPPSESLIVMARLLDHRLRRT